jgi:hypothetical protein
MLLIKQFKVAQQQWNRPEFFGFSASPYLRTGFSAGNGRRKAGHPCDYPLLEEE